jgi:uncharacterized protein (TIGR02246 family)
MSTSSNDIRSIVRRVQDSWNAAFNEGDATAVADLYTDDAIVLPPSHTVIKGPDAIREYWEGLVAVGIKEHGIEIMEADADGGLAYSTGWWWASGPGEGERLEGTLVTVMRRQGDGSWKVCVHAWS